MKYLDENGLLYVWTLLKEKFAGKVDVVDGKGLSTNDLTDELLAKINNAGDRSFNGNYNDLTNIPSINGVTLSGTITDTTLASMNIATLNNISSTLTSAKEYTDDEIKSALADITSITYTIVDSLPTTGEAGVIYLKSASSTGTSNIYEEYIYVNSTFECLGTTNDIDLSGYIQSSDISTITNTEIDTIFAS